MDKDILVLDGGYSVTSLIIAKALMACGDRGFYGNLHGSVGLFPKSHRFCNQDLSNTANQPLKSSYNSKQRKKKHLRKRGVSPC